MNRCWFKCLISSILVLALVTAVEVIGIVKWNIDSSNRQLLELEVEQVVTEYNNGNAPCVDFSKIGTFEWDTLYIFRPYREPKDIDRILGHFWLGSRFTTISTNDRVTLLVFSKAGRVVRYTELWRGTADFSEADNELGYMFQNSCFVLDANGKMILRNQ